MLIKIKRFWKIIYSWFSLYCDPYNLFPEFATLLMGHSVYLVKCYIIIEQLNNVFFMLHEFTVFEIFYLKTFPLNWGNTIVQLSKWVQPDYRSLRLYIYTFIIIIIYNR